MTAYVRLPLVDKRSRPVAELSARPKAAMQRWLPQVQALAQVMVNRQLLVTMVLLAALVSSALAVVYANHLNRSLFIELQTLQAQRDAYQIEWSQLLDRKSTRLNSSHVRISYAVFCLKKKRKHNRAC